MDKPVTVTVKSPPKGRAFWLTFVAVVMTLFLGALDLTAVSTALPTITADLGGGDDFVWVGASYALSSTAFLPLSGKLADIFGRKSIMLISIALFALGSALSGAAQNMNMMIAARSMSVCGFSFRSDVSVAVQGVGGGGIINLTEIITSDLVPLAERGLYQGMLGLTWSLASAIGPPIVRADSIFYPADILQGGALAQSSWRWLFCT